MDRFIVLVNFRPFQHIWQVWNFEHFRVKSKRQLWTNIGFGFGLFVCILAALAECILGVIQYAVGDFDLIKFCTLLPIIVSTLGMVFSAISFIIKNRQIEQVTNEMQKLVDTRNLIVYKSMSFFCQKYSLKSLIFDT